MTIKCNECGKMNFTKNGIIINKSGKHQRYHCKECGHVFLEEDNSKKARGDNDV